MKKTIAAVAIGLSLLAGQAIAQNAATARIADRVGAPAAESSEFAGDDNYANALALYSSFSLTEKLSLHARGEYAWTDTGLLGTGANTTFGGGNWQDSRTEGTTSMTWWNSPRTSFFARIPFGQWATSPSRVPPKFAAT